MRKNNSLNFVLAFVIVVVFCQGCSSSLQEEKLEKKQRISQLLYKFYTRDFPIVIYPLTNRSKQTNFAYLEEAIPEIVGLVLQSMEKDYTLIDGKEYVRLLGFPFTLEQQLVNANIPSWNEYTTLTPMMVTQVHTKITTNDRLITTNIITNFFSTNVLRFQTNSYEIFLQKEFFTLIKSISKFPISWRIEQPKKLQTYEGLIALTNEAKREWTYEGKIQGWFSVRENRIGPSEIEVYLSFTKIKALITNQTNILVKTTEDKIYEELMKKRGMIRRFYLEGDLVDVELVSIPEDANVYFDGLYIGRTPIVYEGVRVGKHRLHFIKEGFATAYYSLDVKIGATNFVQVSLQALDMKGKVLLEGESNRLVFFDSLYVGITPLVISNISLNESHVLLVRSDDRNYEDIQYTFTLTSERPLLVFPVGKGRSKAQRNWQKNRAWMLCYIGWGVTIGLLGAHFYTSSLTRYYEDQLYNPQLTEAQQKAYAFEAAVYAEWQQRFFSYGILSSLVSLGFTAYALSQEQIYLDYDPFSHQWGLEYRMSF